ncbi:hypothetical protein Ancab_013116 [Ancistrocladus abbreviatus]
MKRGRPISPELCNGRSGQADPPRFSHTTQPRLSSGTATANHGVGIFGSPKSVDVQGTHVAPDPNDEAGGGRQKIPAFKEVQPQSSKDDAAVPNPKAVMEGGRQSVSFPNQAHSEVAANRATAVNVQHGFSSVVPDSNAAGVGGRHAASTSNDVHVETDTDAHAVSAATRNPDGHSGSSSDLPVSFAAGVGGRQADSPSNEAHVDTATEAQAVVAASRNPVDNAQHGLSAVRSPANAVIDAGQLGFRDNLQQWFTGPSDDKDEAETIKRIQALEARDLATFEGQV